jgi:hypothetical protein
VPAVSVAEADVALSRHIFAEKSFTTSAQDERVDSAFSKREAENSRTNVWLPLIHIEFVLVGTKDMGEP